MAIKAESAKLGYFSRLRFAYEYKSDTSFWQCTEKKLPNRFSSILCLSHPDNRTQYASRTGLSGDQFPIKGQDLLSPEAQDRTKALSGTK